MFEVLNVFNYEINVPIDLKVNLGYIEIVTDPSN